MRLRGLGTMSLDRLMRLILAIHAQTLNLTQLSSIMHLVNMKRKTPNTLEERHEARVDRPVKRQQVALSDADQEDKSHGSSDTSLKSSGFFQRRIGDLASELPLEISVRNMIMKSSSIHVLC